MMKRIKQKRKDKPSQPEIYLGTYQPAYGYLWCSAGTPGGTEHLVP